MKEGDDLKFVHQTDVTDQFGRDGAERACPKRVSISLQLMGDETEDWRVRVCRPHLLLSIVSSSVQMLDQVKLMHFSDESLNVLVHHLHREPRPR